MKEKYIPGEGCQCSARCSCECRATIEDARRALGATAHEGPLLAAMRVTEQRDRLAEALRELCETLLKGNPRDITDLLNKAGDALTTNEL